MIIVEESDQILAMDRSINQWRDLLPRFNLAIEVFEWLDFDRPTAVLGPVLRLALARLAEICLSVAMDDNIPR